MNEPIVSIFDIETDDIDAKVIRCLSFYDVNTKNSATITDYNVMRKYFQRENVYFCGHHIIGFDIPVVERLLGIKVENPLIDTLALSWTLYSSRNSHGLQSYGDEYGIEKPKIIDYAKQDIEEIKRRCSQDVLINLKVWENQKWYLNELYDGNWEQILKYIAYLTFKLQCVAEQQKLGVKLDIPLIKETLMELEDLKVNKIEVLTAAMPKQPIKTTKKYPKVFKKANGELSANGVKWIELVKEKGLPDDYTGDIEVVTGYNDANPSSQIQVKNFLFDLQWVPEHFKYVKQDNSRELRKIPQISSKTEQGEICESVKKLAEKSPAIAELEGLSIISHRIGILNKFLKDQVNGRLYQGTSNLTNTLRLCHTKICNLPSTDKPYAENIRKAIIPDEGYLICNTDLSSVENNTKLHYLYNYDKEYVLEQMSEGFDPHLDLAITAGFLTKEQAEAHKKGIENHKIIRQKAKTSNYALTYGCGVATLARQGDMSKREAETLHRAYWKRNDSITKASESFITKQIGSQMWIFNPVSKFWYSLRSEKDRFATTNSSTAVYFFDIWVKHLIENGLIPVTQTHDEANLLVLPENKEKTTQLIQNAIDKTNEEINLNVKIGFSVAYGNSYGEVH
jgi:hypothetical protein